MRRDDVMKAIVDNRETIKGFGVKSLGLFGSCARGEDDESSDLDFIVVLSDKTFDAYMGLKFFLEELNGCKVDLVIESTIKPRLRNGIMREAVYVEGL